MASQLASAYPEVLEFESEVTAIDGRAVTLAETYFYAESGGQPSDRGMIDGIAVEEVRIEDGSTVHVLAEEVSTEVGETVECSIDPTFRRYCMCAHTASHAVYGAARERYDSVGYGGFEITPEKVRIDLEVPEPIDDDGLIDLEELTNRVIWEDRPVTWEEWPAEEVRANDEIALNVATEVVETEPTVRVVQIDDWDIAACGGTHLRSTGEIGTVSMIARSNPGEGQTRVEFVVGPERIEQQLREKQAAWQAKTHLGVEIEEVPDRLVKLTDELEAANARISSLEEDHTRARLVGEGANRFIRDGHAWVLTTTDELDASTAASILPSLQGEHGDIIAMAGGSGRAYLVVVTPGEPAATELTDTVLEAFDSGGGGGSPTNAQAGGIDATPTALIDLLTERFAPQSATQD